MVEVRVDTSMRPSRGRYMMAAAVLIILAAGGISFAVTRHLKNSGRLGVPPDTSAVLPPVAPLRGPWVVALQPGHWKIADVPPELNRFRDETGAVWGKTREANINLAVVNALVPKLEALGWTVMMVPSTIPPGLRADAFISVHADGASDTNREGWKLSAPWRPNEASKLLADDMAKVFSTQTDMAEDADGVTANMRGYFGFSYRRFRHAISPYTPAILIELGFVTNAHDRKLLTGPPDYWADLIERGLEDYFKQFDRTDIASLIPIELPQIASGNKPIEVRATPSDEGTVIATLRADSFLFPVDKTAGWYEVFVRGYMRSGWVKMSDVSTVDVASRGFTRYRYR